MVVLVVLMGGGDYGNGYGDGDCGYDSDGSHRPSKVVRFFLNMLLCMCVCFFSPLLIYNSKFCTAYQYLYAVITTGSGGSGSRGSD